MYAVIASGGKQYRVTQGQTLKLEKLPIEAGKVVAFDQVLMISDGQDIKVGTPYLKGVKVEAEVLDQGRRKKIEIIKFKRRKHYMRRAGHRQDYTEVKISSIGGAKAEKKVAKAAVKQPAEAKKTAAKVAVAKAKTATQKKAPAKKAVVETVAKGE